MGQGRTRFPLSTEPFSSRMTAELSNGGIAKNQRRRFIGHQAADYSAGGCQVQSRQRRDPPARWRAFSCRKRMPFSGPTSLRRSALQQSSVRWFRLRQEHEPLEHRCSIGARRCGLPLLHRGHDLSSAPSDWAGSRAPLFELNQRQPWSAPPVQRRRRNSSRIKTKH